MATILIPTALRQYAGQQNEVSVSGATIDEVLGSLTDTYPELRKQIYSEAGKLRNFVNIYLNEDDVRYLQKGSTPVAAQDTISIIPAIAGGSALLARFGAQPPPPAQGEGEELSHEEIRRYSRHLIVPEVGLEGQKKLKASSVLLIGAGGLGSPLALYLAAAGVGRIGIVDFDVVDESNLQRQVIHGTSAVGTSKLESAKSRILDINPLVRVDTYPTPLTSENALDILRPYDVIVDGTDNFPTRYLVNDACVLLNKPNVYGSIFRFEGQASVFWAELGPCYRCLYPEPPPPGLVPSCAEGGVLGILPGTVGTIQATETIKLLLGIGKPLIGRLLLYNALDMEFRELRLRKDPECPLCGEHPTVTELIDYQQFCGIDPQAERGETDRDITPRELRDRLVRGDNLVLVDVREPHEWSITHLEGATLIPLNTIPQRVHELSTADELVLYCKGGTRSARAVAQLRELGFRKLWNLKGGINAWAEQVDPSLPRY
ncbi:MAG: molybdopterin-synthase adenylyltransferase MoeB [Chloroflexia bacterium]